MSGDIQWVAATQDGWEFGLIVPDFEAIRGFFEYLLDQPIDFNIRWIVKDQNSSPFQNRQALSKIDPVAKQFQVINSLSNLVSILARTRTNSPAEIQFPTRISKLHDNGMRLRLVDVTLGEGP